MGFGLEAIKNRVEKAREGKTPLNPEGRPVTAIELAEGFPKAMKSYIKGEFTKNNSDLDKDNLDKNDQEMEI